MDIPSFYKKFFQLETELTEEDWLMIDCLRSFFDTLKQNTIDNHLADVYEKYTDAKDISFVDAINHSFTRGVEVTKKELLKHLMPVRQQNGYGIDAVPKSIVLSIDNLVLFNKP